MDSIKVDEELSLVLVHDGFAVKYVQLVDQDRDYLSEWLPWVTSTHTVEDYQEFIKKSLSDHADGKSLVCGIEYLGELVGSAGFVRIHPKLQKAEIGYWLASSRQGCGIITRVCKKLFELAFNDYGLSKVQITAAEHNTKSRAVCERLGMNLEGIITNAEVLDGKIRSHAVYGIHRP